VAAAHVESEDEQHRQYLCDGARDTDHTGQRAGEVVRDRVAGAVDDRRRVPPQPIGDAEQRPARPTKLPATPCGGSARNGTITIAATAANTAAARTAIRRPAVRQTYASA